MLGRDHINISIAFFLPFLIPFLFLDTGNIIFLVVLMASIFIGSLLPDADCGGRASIYYKFPLIDKFAFDENATFRSGTNYQSTQKMSEK